MVDYVKNLPRFYKSPRVTEAINDMVIPVDSTHWNKPRGITLKMLGDQLKVVIDESYLKQLKIEQDLIVQAYNNQAIDPIAPPQPDLEVKKTYMAVDDNYLYIWIESKNRWKRVLLSDW